MMTSTPCLSSLPVVRLPLLLFLTLLLAVLPAVLPGQINIFLGGVGAGDDSNLSFDNLALPLTLLSFSTAVEGGTVVLRWDTENENDLAGFRLERSSDGRHFQALGRLPASADAAPGEQRTYRFTDNEPLAGTSYYRLRIADLDGSITYSDVRQIDFQEERWTFGLSPNPSHGGAVTIHATGREAGEHFQLKIYDALGRVIHTATCRTTSPDSEISIPATLPGGNYFVRLQRESGDVFSRQLVVIR